MFFKLCQCVEGVFFIIFQLLRGIILLGMAGITVLLVFIMVPGIPFGIGLLLFCSPDVGIIEKTLGAIIMFLAAVLAMCFTKNGVKIAKDAFSEKNAV